MRFTYLAVVVIYQSVIYFVGIRDENDIYHAKDPIHNQTRMREDLPLTYHVSLKLFYSIVMF